MSREQDKANMRAFHMDGLRESLAMREQAASSTQAGELSARGDIAKMSASGDTLAEVIAAAKHVVAHEDGTVSGGAWLRSALGKHIASSTTPASGDSIEPDYRRVLQYIVDVMGPKVPPCCEGCEFEWGAALHAAQEALAAQEGAQGERGAGENLGESNVR